MSRLQRYKLTLQDALIVLSIIIILIAFSSTFVFQAGLITLLLKKFASTIILSLIYLALSALLHFYDMVEIVNMFKTQTIVNVGPLHTKINENYFASQVNIPGFEDNELLRVLTISLRSILTHYLEISGNKLSKSIQEFQIEHEKFDLMIQ
uniref:Transmembrane protein 138 n=1 Tax=Wuchereria bancrofti TaxID=6293 RepID=A0AAF5Q5C1_WUCBA